MGDEVVLCCCGKPMSLHYDSRDEYPPNAVLSHPGTPADSTPTEREGVAEVLFRVMIQHQRIPTYTEEGGNRCVGCDNLRGESDGSNSPRHVDHIAAHLADALAPLIAARVRAAKAEAWGGAGDDEGPVNAIPTPPQLLRRMADATADERLAWAERAIVNSEKAHECFVFNHRRRIAHLERRAAEAEAKLARVEALADEIERECKGGDEMAVVARQVRRVVVGRLRAALGLEASGEGS